MEEKLSNRCYWTGSGTQRTASPHPTYVLIFKRSANCWIWLHPVLDCLGAIHREGSIAARRVFFSPRPRRARILSGASPHFTGSPLVAFGKGVKNESFRGTVRLAPRSEEKLKFLSFRGVLLAEESLFSGI